MGISEAIRKSTLSASAFTRQLFEEQWPKERVAEFINLQRNATVASTSSNGQPHAAVVIAACAQDEIYFTVHPESVLFRNITANNRIAMSVCDSAHAVMCQGQAIALGSARDLPDLIDLLASSSPSGVFTPKGWDGLLFRIDLRRLVAN